MNLSYVKDTIPQREEFGRIITADDGSYVQPALTWRKTGTWKDYTIGQSSYVQRPPGYGMLFLIGTYLSPSNPYFFLKILQILGFFVSIFLVFRILKLFNFDDKWALVATALYALLPTFSGFLYHVITEGITPVLMLWSTLEWILILKENGNKARWIGSSAFMLLVRPQMGLFILVFMIPLLFQKRFKLLLWSFLAFLPFALWMVRVYSYTGEVNLHPIYSENNQSFYRPPHEAMGDLFKIWEYKSDRFHETMAILQQEGDLKKALQNVPPKYHKDVRGILFWYVTICTYERQGIFNGEMSSFIKNERQFVQNLEEVKSDILMNNLTDAYLKTPMRSAIELSVNSHLHLSIFQSKFRGALWMEAIRWVSLLIVLGGITALFVNACFWKNVPRELWLICLAGSVTFLYLVFVQRLNEERYLTPMLPLAFIAAVWLFRSRFLKLTSKIKED